MNSKELDIFDIRNPTSWFFPLLGTPMLLAGLAVIYAGFTGALKTDSGAPASIYFYLPLGGLFTLIAASMVFFRYGKRLTKDPPSITEWFGVLSFPLGRSTRPLDGYRRLVLSEVGIKNGTRKGTVFRLVLEGDGETEILQTASDKEAARSEAQEIASFLGLVVRDTTL